jgi:hypothetical protein
MKNVSKITLGLSHYNFIRLRLNTLLLAAGMKGKVNRAEAR